MRKSWKIRALLETLAVRVRVRYVWSSCNRSVDPEHAGYRPGGRSKSGEVAQKRTDAKVADGSDNLNALIRVVNDLVKRTPAN